MFSFTHSRLETSDGESGAATGAPASTSSSSAAAAHDPVVLAALHADPRHWSETRVCGGIEEGFYFCKADPRVCVRKRGRQCSYTLNFGHARAVPVALLFILAVTLLPALLNSLTLVAAIADAKRRC